MKERRKFFFINKKNKKKQKKKYFREIWAKKVCTKMGNANKGHAKVVVP